MIKFMQGEHIAVTLPEESTSVVIERDNQPDMLLTSEEWLELVEMIYAFTAAVEFESD